MEIQIISGFLGAGKTTFLNKYLPYLSGKTAVIENEFGEVGLDGALIQGDIPVRELSAGCICCTLAMDLTNGIAEISKQFSPDRIVIEPSGIGKLSDVMSACESAKRQVNIEITKRIVIVDACDCALFAEEFGQFYSNQIEYANIIFFSNIQEATEEELKQCLACVRKLNSHAIIYEEDWRELEKDTLLSLLDITENWQSDLHVEKSEPEILLSPTEQVFTSVVLEDSALMSENDIQELLGGLGDEKLGYILRAKGIVPAEKGYWHFDYTNSIQSYEKMMQVKEEMNRVIVIGSGLKKKEIRNYIYSFGEE